LHIQGLENEINGHILYRRVKHDVPGECEYRFCEYFDYFVKKNYVFNYIFM